MKKKIFLILFLLLVINIYKQTDTISIIPDSSIRLRVIPNSNDSLDVNIKEQVKKYLENLLLIMRYLLLMRILLKLVKM